MNFVFISFLLASDKQFELACKIIVYYALQNQLFFLSSQPIHLLSCWGESVGDGKTLLLTGCFPFLYSLNIHSKFLPPLQSYF